MKSLKSVRFSIRRPLGARRSFGITRDVLLLSGDREQTVVEDPRLSAINLNMQRGLLTVDQAYAEVKGSLVPALKREAQVKAKESLLSQVHENNRITFQSFWKEKYADSEILPRSKVAAQNLILAALKDLGDTSIVSASRTDIRDKLKDVPTHRQRRHCIGINQLLGFLGRGFEIEKRRPDAKEVEYVTWEELQPILERLTPEVRALAISLFGTGVRLGEAFAPGFTRLKPDGTIYIRQQLDLEGEIREIKNRKAHFTFLLPQCREGYQEWCRVPNKSDFRVSAVNQVIRASRLAYPKDPHKQVSCHDLRHSYAIHMLGKGASLSQVAGLLGDSIATTEQHYTGFVLTAEMVSGIQRLFG